MFCWKDNFFQVFVHNDIVIGEVDLDVKWRSLCSSASSIEDTQVQDQTECPDFDCHDILVEDSPLVSPKFTYYYRPPQSSGQLAAYSDKFLLGKKNEINCNLLRTGFAFDSTTMCRVPVILIEIEKVLKDFRKDNPFATVHQKSELGRISSKSTANDGCHHKKFLLIGVVDNLLSSVAIQKESGEKRFSLVPLRLFTLPNPCNIILQNEYNNLRFVPDYGLFYLDKSNTKLPLTFQLLFGHHSKMSQTVTQTFTDNEVGVSKHFDSDIQIMDLFNSFINKIFLVVIQWTTLESHPKCSAFLIYNLHTLKYEMERIENDLLFPSDFEQIANSLIISSATLTNSPPCIKSSSLVMLTSTKYAIRFSQGIMTHCVPIDMSFHIYINFEGQAVRNKNCIDYAWGTERRTALHIKDSCLLVDWANEKISVLQPEKVQMIGRCEHNDSSRVAEVLSILFKKRKKDDLDKWMISNIDVAEGTEHDENEERSIANSMISQSSLHSQDYGAETKMDEAAKNVLNGLICQEKKCQIDVTDMEQSLRCKETFILQTLKHFSDLKDDGSASLNVNHFDMPPLVPVTDHIELVGGRNDQSKIVHRHWKVQKLWKRTIDKFLVCGVDLVKISLSAHLCDIYLVLVPINPCRNIQSKSSLLHRLPSHLASLSSLSSSVPPSSAESSSSPARKRICLTNPQQNKHDTTSNMPSSSSSVRIAAYLDTHDFWGSENIRIQVYLTYTAVLQSGGTSTTHATKESYKVDCGVVSVTREEKLQEFCSLRSAMKKYKQEDFLNAEDITALDCVQTSYDFSVTSMLNSVTSLLQKVRGHSSMTYLPQFDQYIYSADHRLQFCRLKWLKQSDQCNAVIRLFSSTQDDLLFFIEFLDFISPSDVSIHLKNCVHEKSKGKSLNVIANSLCEKVEQSIIKINKDLDTITIIPANKYDDVVEIIEDFPSSPTFHSSIQKADSTTFENKETKKLQNQNPSTSGSVASVASVPTRSKESVKKVSRIDDDLSQFEFGNGFAACKIVTEGNGKKGLGTKKTSKSKLMMKKK